MTLSYPLDQTPCCRGLFKAVTTAEPGRLPSVQSSALQPKQACACSLFVRVRSPSTRSPATTRLSSSGKTRRIRLPRRGSAHLAVCSALARKMPRSDFCNRLHDTSTRVNRSTPESPSSFAFAFEAGFHDRPPDRDLGDDMTSGGAPLDGGPPALVWPSMSSGFPRDPLHSDL
jgi:hypothetical protein